MMNHAIQHADEIQSNDYRSIIDNTEAISQRTYTPSQLVIAQSKGIYHWTAEGRKLIDFSSGVLVSNLGHNPKKWFERFLSAMSWNSNEVQQKEALSLKKIDLEEDFFKAVPFTAYNAITPVESLANQKLIALLQKTKFGKNLQKILWAASGSEGIQKALWAALAKNPERPIILATRFGFHGKKGLAGSVSGSESDPDRDPRVKFISFPLDESSDISKRPNLYNWSKYIEEWEKLIDQHGNQIGIVITEPYLGGGGSFHPPKEFLQQLQSFCRKYNIVFILDEVQSNFGRTGEMFAFEKYELEPDLVVLGKGLGNGVPIAAVVGRADLLSALHYGEGSDTWSGNPLGCAAVVATIDEFLTNRVLEKMKTPSEIIEKGLVELKKYPFISAIRGEEGGMVWGIECQDFGNRSARDWANEIVLGCYRGICSSESHSDKIPSDKILLSVEKKNPHDFGNGSENANTEIKNFEEIKGIHLLGPLAGKVIRVSPPLIISIQEAKFAIELMHRIFESLLLKTRSNSDCSR